MTTIATAKKCHCGQSDVDNWKEHPQSGGKGTINGLVIAWATHHKATRCVVVAQQRQATPLDTKEKTP